jgi:cyclic pyranopterin phosphate synthase
MLRDNYQRKHDYLRISVTDKCNLRCTYCMPRGVKQFTHDEVLRNEEFVHFIGLFVELGVRKIRFTGGEPLVRKGIMDIIAQTREQFPDVELCLTTNGVLLDEVLDDLHRLNIRKLNISLDTLSPQRYAEITGRHYLDRVLSNIERALQFDFFDIKINAVLFRETLDELDHFLENFKEKKVTLRFIERMPFTSDKQFSEFLSADDFVNALELRGELIRDNTIDTNVAIMFQFNYRSRYPMFIGVIPPLTHKFCSRCNRLRLTCNGLLKTCLLSKSEYDLKSPYRADVGDESLTRIILKAVREKPKQHTLDSSCNVTHGCSSLEFERISMNRIGG